MHPIGIFDSGVGGLSVWREIAKTLPKESTLYFADSHNCPYGEKSCEEVLRYSIAATQFLVDNGAKLVVVACNTATTVAIHTLRQMFSIPFVGIEPAIKPAALSSKSGAVGVLATQGTISSPFYNETKERFASELTVIAQPGFGLVEAVENGRIDSPEVYALLEKYLLPMVGAGIDKLVLGCTHYPFLIRAIESIVGDGVEVINPAPAVARQCRAIIEKESRDLSCKNVASYTFYTSGDREKMARLLFSLTGESMDVAPTLRLS